MTQIDAQNSVLKIPLYTKLQPAIVALTLTSFVAATYGFGMYLFAAILPAMRLSLGFSYQTVGVITSMAQVAFMLFAIGGALLAHRIGGAWVAILSMIVCSASLILVPTVSNVVVIGALLVLLGGCAASVYVPMVELASRTVPQSHRGKVLGLISSGTSYGVFINGLLAPHFLASGTWQGIWLAVGTISVAFTVIGFAVLARAGALSAADRPTKTVPQDADVPAKRGLMKTLGRAETWVLLILAITLLNGMTTMPFQNYLTSYLEDELGHGVALSGQLWATIGFIGMFSGFLLGTLADKIGIRATMLLTYALLLTASGLLVFFPVKEMLLIAGVCFALAFYPIFGLVPAYIAKTPSNLSGTSIFAIANVTLGVGGIAGNFFGGYWAGLTGSFIGIYVIIGILTIVTGALAWALPAETRGNE
ncbi:MFS transporter [Puniceibacterium sediminis]|uniref:Nitrate/nitrite transporter NarK n=1 Tax=Puniceibacterium sediminis TaxID=1608407 RepID=A0A238YU51_9RHOB|nr:MFS transporter [Puniceibacterium sediminis]SNR74318.1 Nitrate/nitrite transporter NarK [Puniceibacterium sediminis]